MLRLCVMKCYHQGGGRRAGPTLTVSSTRSAVMGGPPSEQPPAAAAVVRTWKERIIRPITQDEENYELLRVQKNAKSNLKIKGKQSVQLSKRSTRNYNSYDQI